MLNSVDLLASIPNQGAMYATTDNDKPAAERLRFYPKRLSRALRKGIAFRRGLLHKDVPSQLCLTESELAFLLHMTLNLFASPGSSTIHENVVNTLLDFNQDFMDKKRSLTPDPRPHPLTPSPKGEGEAFGGEGSIYQE